MLDLYDERYCLRPECICIGKDGRPYLRKRDIDVIYAAKVSMAKACARINEQIIGRFIREEIAKLPTGYMVTTPFGLVNSFFAYGHKAPTDMQKILEAEKAKNQAVAKGIEKAAASGELLPERIPLKPISLEEANAQWKRVMFAKIPKRDINENICKSECS